MNSVKTMELMTNPESSSYFERRQMFKNIWDTAMNIDEKVDIINKPKIIKTLRLNEMDKMVVGKSKKQRIKNLRQVCRRILDFCDKHDAEDTLYEQLQADGQESPTSNVIQDIKTPKKIKTYRRKRKVKKAKSMSVPSPDPPSMKITISNDFLRNAEAETSRITSPSKINIDAYVKSSDTKKKVKSKMRRKTSAAKSGATIGDNKSRNAPTKLRTVKKRLSKRKKSANVFSTGFVTRNLRIARV